MTRDDTIRMAKEANKVHIEDKEFFDFAERFAALVTAAEREEIKKKLLSIGALEDGDFIAAILARNNQT